MKLSEFFLMRTSWKLINRATKEPENSKSFKSKIISKKNLLAVVKTLKMTTHSLLEISEAAIKKNLSIKTTKRIQREEKKISNFL